MYKDQSLMKKAKTLGADGLLLKNTDDSTLFNVLENIYQGNNFWDTSIFDFLITDEQVENKISYSDTYKKISLLTDRENDILVLLARSYSSKEIAEELGISEQTVATHRKHIKKKLKLKNMADIVKFAFDNQII